MTCLVKFRRLTFPNQITHIDFLTFIKKKKKKVVTILLIYLTIWSYSIDCTLSLMQIHPFIDSKNSFSSPCTEYQRFMKITSYCQGDLELWSASC